MQRPPLDILIREHQNCIQYQRRQAFYTANFVGVDPVCAYTALAQAGSRLGYHSLGYHNLSCQDKLLQARKQTQRLHHTAVCVSKQATTTASGTVQVGRALGPFFLPKPTTVDDGIVLNVVRCVYETTAAAHGMLMHAHTLSSPSISSHSTHQRSKTAGCIPASSLLAPWASSSSPASPPLVSGHAPCRHVPTSRAPCLCS